MPGEPVPPDAAAPVGETVASKGEVTGARVKMGDRVLVTTLTKRMAENLTDYLAEHNVKVRYLHSDVETVERVEIIRDLRSGHRRQARGEERPEPGQLIAGERRRDPEGGDPVTTPNPQRQYDMVFGTPCSKNTGSPAPPIA